MPPSAFVPFSAAIRYCTHNISSPLCRASPSARLRVCNKTLTTTASSSPPPSLPPRTPEDCQIHQLHSAPHLSSRTVLPSIALALSFLRPQPAAALSAATVLYAPLFSPLQEASPQWLRTLVWLDFRVAVALFVVTPFALFIWSIFDNESTTDAVKRILIGYWQASSLLMLTVFLNIGNQPVAAATGLFVQALIPVTLTWWSDLLTEVAADSSPLSRAFKAWRLPAVVAALAGVSSQIPNQFCNFGGDPSRNPMCAAWLEPPHALYDIAFAGVDRAVFVSIAFAGLAIYMPYLAWLTFGVLPKVGREGRKDRNCFSAVSALKDVGLIDRDSPGN